MKWKARVRQIFVMAPSPDYSTGRKYIAGANLHVGDYQDPRRNPKCFDGGILDSGLYSCNLVGKFVGISRLTSHSEPLALVELIAFYTIAATPQRIKVMNGSEDMSETVQAAPWNKRSWNLEQSK